MREFFIPGGSIAKDAPDNLLDDLEVAHDCLGRARTAGTWRRYLGPWRKARAYMTEKLKANGVAFTCDNIRNDQRILIACIANKYKLDDTLTGVDMMSAAVKWALKLNGVQLEVDFHLSTIRRVAQNERTCIVNKKAGLTATQVRSICDAWGTRRLPPYHRSNSSKSKRDLQRLMMAAAMGVGYLTLARFSDLATMVVGGIWWCDDGVQICLTVRKNNQTGSPEWVPIADSRRPNSVVSVLRRYVESMGYIIPEEGCIPDAADFLFRPVSQDNGKTHRHLQAPRLGDGSVMLKFSPSKDYAQFLRFFRFGLSSCCGVPKDQLKLYGTQSMRSGGNTLLWRKGIPAEIRREIGRWATPSVERGYLRIDIRERLNLVKELGV